MKTKVFILIAIIAPLLAIAASCSKSSADQIKATQADTLNVSYSATVVPILQTQCYKCHGNGSTGGSNGILLEGYANIFKWTQNGYLIGNITHAQGYVGMPFGQPKMDDNLVNPIVAWVHQGAKNN